MGWITGTVAYFLVIYIALAVYRIEKAIKALSPDAPTERRETKP
jgi:hypothetical protein